MKYKIERTARFKKDYKRIIKRGYDARLLAEVIALLADGIPLPDKYEDHQLKGSLKEFRECHITPDWLLMYKINKDILCLFLTRTGTHSDLFDE